MQPSLQRSLEHFCHPKRSFFSVYIVYCHLTSIHPSCQYKEEDEKDDIGACRALLLRVEGCVGVGCVGVCVRAHIYMRVHVGVDVTCTCANLSSGTFTCFKCVISSIVI